MTHSSTLALDKEVDDLISNFKEFEKSVNNKDKNSRNNIFSADNAEWFANVVFNLAASNTKKLSSKQLESLAAIVFHPLHTNCLGKVFWAKYFPSYREQALEYLLKYLNQGQAHSIYNKARCAAEWIVEIKDNSILVKEAVINNVNAEFLVEETVKIINQIALLNNNFPLCNNELNYELSDFYKDLKPSVKLGINL